MEQQHHHLVPSSSSQMASSVSRRSIFGRRSPDNKKKKTRKHNTKEDRTLRALEAIRLLAFDFTEGSKKSSSSPSTPRTVTTLSSDDTTEEESNDESRTFKKPTGRPKLLLALRPLPIERNSSGGTSRTHQRSDSNVSYLSSDTSSEIGEWLSLDDEQDYPTCINISHSSDNTTSSSSPRYGQLQQTHSNSRRLSVSALDEWNRRCEEEDGGYHREKYASEMLNLNQSITLNQHHQHGANKFIDRRNSFPLSPLETDYYGDFCSDGTEEDDISLTYSHGD
eukprot:scaffold34596_cov116-Skeletonema_dohrnii-CCMP3373.AAC.3